MNAQQAIIFLCEEKGVNPMQNGTLKDTVAYRIKWLSARVPETHIEKWLTAILSHAEFKFVAQGFLPSLALMETVLRPTVDALEIEGEKTFEQIMKNLSRYEHFTTSNPRTAAGLTACGGWIALCDCQIDRIDFKRKEFVKAYSHCQKKECEPVTYHGLLPHERKALCIDTERREQIEGAGTTLMIAEIAEAMRI